MDIESRIIHLEAHCARGWHVFPCNGKRPMTKNGSRSASDDIVRWRSQWSPLAERIGTPPNIGLAAGPSNLVIVDCDIDKENPTSWYRKNGPFTDEGMKASEAGCTLPGISEYLAICEEFGDGHDPFNTYAVGTPSGGVHFYYYSEDSFAVPRSNGQWGHGGYDGETSMIDIRSGWYYALGAGSDIDGVEYELIGGDDPMPLPSWLYNMLMPVPRSPAARAKLVQQDVRRYTDDSVKWLTWMVNDILEAPEGTRNTTFAAKVWRVAQCNGTGEDFDILADAARECGLDDREIEATLRTIGQ